MDSYLLVDLLLYNCIFLPKNQMEYLKLAISFNVKQAYDNQSSYDVPFFKTLMQDNVHAQGSTSSSEVLVDLIL